MNPVPLLAYRHLADAWAGGVADWCASVAKFALQGGQAWCVTAGPGQSGWIKRQLLAAGVPVFGIRFLDSAADLRRALCERFAVEAPPFGRETLELLLRVRADALGNPDPSATRQPAPLLAALEELDAAGWLDGENFGEVEPLLSPALLADGLLGNIRRHPAWGPGVDRRLRALAESGPAPGDAPALSVLVLGWDAACLRRLDLLATALRAATGYRAGFLPLPRAEAETLSQEWLETVAAALGAREWETCPPADADAEPTPLGQLVERLESLEAGPPEDEDAALPVRPEMLVGRDGADQVALARDFVARWLAESGKSEVGSRKSEAKVVTPTGSSSPTSDLRLAILTPGRSPTAVALGRALGAAGILFEDAVGERPETVLPVQIARAVVDYYLDDTGVGPLLTLVGLLNDHPECLDAHEFGLPLDPLALRAALAEAFTDLQHTSAPLLAAGGAFGKAAIAGPVRRLVEHLGRWPETLGWAAARTRWELTLRGFRLHAAILGPAWPRAAGVLPAEGFVSRRAFFEYLLGLLAATGGGARVMPEGGTRFARVTLTTVAEAANQTWHSLLFLDCNEGVWPRPPGENPFLDDRRRGALNASRTAPEYSPRRNGDTEAEKEWGGAEPESFSPSVSRFLRGEHPLSLLTSGDRVRLDACRLYATLENAAPDARLAFASVRLEPGDPGREAHPNEWSLRCWIESASAAERAADGWLTRWRAATRRFVPAVSRRKGLSGAESEHLQEVFDRRRDPAVPFDEYGFDFRGLGAAPAAGELAFEPAWEARELLSARDRPAAFALARIFGVNPTGKAGAPAKAEAWAVGRLTHRWVRAALNGHSEPEPLDVARVNRALGPGLTAIRQREETALRRSLGLADADGIPPWWASVLAKTAWATRRCLEELAGRVEADPHGSGYFCQGREWDGAIETSAGKLRLRGRSDLLLLDRPTLDGAVCQVVDVKTGGHGGTAAAKGAPGLAAELFLAVASGADPERSTVAVLHPETAGWDGPAAAGFAGLLVTGGKDGDDGTLAALAAAQGGLRFGQGAEETGLPLAMTPIAARTLRAKAERK